MSADIVQGFLFDPHAAHVVVWVRCHLRVSKQVAIVLGPEVANP